jgi:F-type H+-transporting ATPase subunit delta
MAVRLSRRKISAYLADELIAGKKDVPTRLAALLLDTRRMRELPLIVRDIEDALATRGVVIADIDSAYQLSTDTKKQLEAFVRDKTNAKQVHFRTAIDETLLGGVRVNLPGQELDATLRRKLTNLKATKQ